MSLLREQNQNQNQVVIHIAETTHPEQEIIIIFI